MNSNPQLKVVRPKQPAELTCDAWGHVQIETVTIRSESRVATWCDCDCWGHPSPHCTPARDAREQAL